MYVYQCMNILPATAPQRVGSSTCVCVCVSAALLFAQLQQCWLLSSLCYGNQLRIAMQKRCKCRNINKDFYHSMPCAGIAGIWSTLEGMFGGLANFEKKLMNKYFSLVLGVILMVTIEDILFYTIASQYLFFLSYIIQP